MADKAVVVWVLSDGRAGHYNQARGIIKALSFGHDLQVEWVELRLRAGFLRTLLRAFLNHTRMRPGLKLLHMFYSISLPGSLPGLIVSSGGRTSFANVWLAHHFGVPNIFAGSLRRLSPGLFSAVLTLEPLPGARNNVVVTVPPSVIDVEEISRVEVPEALSGQHCWAMLVGGNGAGYHYTKKDWESLALLLNTLAGKYAIRWLVSTSPRSGKLAGQVLRECVDDVSVAATSWYGDTPDNPTMTYLAAAEKLFVTEDSMTMLAEAIGAGKQVFSLCPDVARPNQRYLGMLQRFEKLKMIRRLRIDEILHNPDVVKTIKVAVTSESPLKTLAAKLDQYIQL